MIKTMLAIALVAGCAIGSANAQSFPSRPITILVPLAAGGSTDTIGRIMAEGMRPHLGQPVIVENSPGAGGSTGVIRVARSAPDGYLVQIGQWGTNVAGGAVYDLPIDLLKDLEPVGLISTQPFMIVGRKTLPPNNLKELIAWLKANPGATFGNAGIGSPGHVSSIFFQNTIGAKIQPIPYRSAGPASQDLIAGNIDLMMDTAATSGPTCATACSRPTRCLRTSARWRCRTCRRWMRQGCRDSISTSGMRCGCQRARRRRSSPSSTTRW